MTTTTERPPSDSHHAVQRLTVSNFVTNSDDGRKPKAAALGRMLPSHHLLM